MELFINNAILHVLNNDGGESFLSTEELDIDSDVCYEFITKHVKKLIDNPAAKEATFVAESKSYEIFSKFVNGEIFFKEASTQLCGRLQEIMNANVDIPSADVLFAQFEMEDEPYLAILKLNYKECFTHQVDKSESGSDNQIIKYRAVLPFDSGKVEEACIIPYNPMIIKLLEKPYLVDGEPTNYFSSLFLECTPELSKKEAAQIINEITEEIIQKFPANEIETIAKVKAALLEEAEEEEGTINIDNIADRVFSDNEEIKKEYISLAHDAGIKTEINLGKKFTKQQFGSHKFKADNGIEIKFPADLTDDSETIEFINNDDGSVSIHLKNLRRSVK